MLDPRTTGQVSGMDGTGDPGDRRTGRARGDQPRLLQRDAMFAELRQILEGTWSHPRCSIMFEGLPGTGKSAALNATFAMANDLGVRAGSARCDAAESSTPFEAVRQVFASLLGHSTIFDQPINDGVDLAHSVLRSGDGMGRDAVDIYHSLLSLLGTFGSEPVIIGIDDVQWADPMSLGWFQFLARRLPAVPVHLVLTMRTTRGVSSGGSPLVFGPAMRRFAIHPLSLEATRSVIEGHFGVSCDAAFVAAAHDLTDGNPRMLARVLNALDETTIPAAHITASDLDGVESPITARAISSRASMLGDGALEFVEAVAVLGPTDIRVVAAVAGVEHDRAARLADLLADLGVLGWDRPIDFTHRFQRQCVVAEIPPTRRAETHATAARVLARFGRSITEIAAHIFETEPAGDESTTAFLIDAARHHIGAAEFVDADRILERAEREAPTNLLRAEVALLCAEVDGRLGRSGVVEHLKRASHFGIDPVILAETALDIVDRRRDLQSSSAILAMVQSVRGELEIEHGPTARRLELVESVCLPVNERPPHDPSQTEPRHDVLEASITEDLFAIEQALRSAAQMRSSHDELLTSLRMLLTPEVLRPAGFVHSVIVGAALHALVRMGAHEIADPLLRSAITEGTNGAGHKGTAGYTLILAESMAMQGKVIAADQMVRHLNADPGSALRQCVIMERRWFAALRERGAHVSDLAGFAVKMAAPGLSDLGFSATMLLAETSARVQLLEGDWTAALATLDRLGAVADSVSVQNPAFVPWRVGRCAALAELGRFEEGAALADENLRLAQSFGCPMTVAEALACIARFEPPAAQIGLLQQAIAMLSGTAAELLRCNLFIELGFARHHAGDAAEARSALREGADQATRLGASRLAGVAGRGLLACGARPRRLHTSGRESLTPAEIRVVRLAAEGQTNAAIAEGLFINMKTVESHLTRAYRKLGITDRAELADALGSQLHAGTTSRG